MTKNLIKTNYRQRRRSVSPAIFLSIFQLFHFPIFLLSPHQSSKSSLPRLFPSLSFTLTFYLHACLPVLTNSHYFFIFVSHQSHTLSHPLYFLPPSYILSCRSRLPLLFFLLISSVTCSIFPPSNQSSLPLICSVVSPIIYFTSRSYLPALTSSRLFSITLTNSRPYPGLPTLTSSRPLSLNSPPSRPYPGLLALLSSQSSLLTTSRLSLCFPLSFPLHS